MNVALLRVCQLKTIQILVFLFILAGWETMADSFSTKPAKDDALSHIFTIVEGTNKTRVDLSYCVFSKSCSNLFVAYQSATRKADDFPADKPIEFGSGSETNYDYTVLMLRPEYGCRLFAKSEDGKEVQLTRTGKHYGEKFDAVKAYNKDLLDWTLVPGRYNPKTPCRTIARHDIPYISRIFPAPQKLFNFEKPGKYTMWIELQYFARPDLPHSTNLYLVRFQPVKLTVIKKEDQK